MSTNAFKQNKAAFPNPGKEYWDGEKWNQQQGMNLRQYFAGQAPKEVPAWFVPVLPPEPEGNWIDEDAAWHQNARIQTFAQWPWFWADMVLAAQTPDEGPQAD